MQFEKFRCNRLVGVGVGVKVPPASHLYCNNLDILPHAAGANQHSALIKYARRFLPFDYLLFDNCYGCQNDRRQKNILLILQLCLATINWCIVGIEWFGACALHGYAIKSTDMHANLLKLSYNRFAQVNFIMSSQLKPKVVWISAGAELRSHTKLIASGRRAWEKRKVKAHLERP